MEVSGQPSGALRRTRRFRQTIRADSEVVRRVCRFSLWHARRTRSRTHRESVITISYVNHMSITVAVFPGTPALCGSQFSRVIDTVKQVHQYRNSRYGSDSNERPSRRSPLILVELSG